MAIPTPQFHFHDQETPLENGTVEAIAPSDLRLLRVEEFLRSRELSDNTRKAYTRDLHRFLEWTDKP